MVNRSSPASPASSAHEDHCLLSKADLVIRGVEMASTPNTLIPLLRKILVASLTVVPVV